MKYELRDYQKEAVQAGVDFFSDNKKGNAIEVLPTGSGKSLIIANIAKQLDNSVIVFQPSKEILEQNFQKYISYGNFATIYSASVGEKRLSDVTFATIGSVAKKPDILRDFKYIIVDECHSVNSKDGMYKNLFDVLSESKILGLTATPYRLVTDGFGGSILKFLTRTKPKVFSRVIYHVQNRHLFDQGYLSSLKYYTPTEFNQEMLTLNTTGADFTDRSVQNYYESIGFKDRIIEQIESILNSGQNCNGILVFTKFTEEAEYIARHLPGIADIVTAETPKGERESKLRRFKSGELKVMTNVGVLTTGFDYPELDTVIIARPTMSLALYYQMIGRPMRPHPSKPFARIIDMCNNIKRFGKVEDLKLVDQGNGKWVIMNNGRQLTNVYYGQREGQQQKKGGYGYASKYRRRF